MASPEVLAFAELLAPISGDNPAGSALREDHSAGSVYHRIKDARAKARAAERSAVWGEEEAASQDNRADWRPVVEFGSEAIAQKSKDLEVAAWLTEALLREHGYAGLRDGFQLMRELAELFWDQLYPLPDEDGVFTRVAPLAGLNGDEAEGVLLAPIAGVPITAAGSLRALTLADYRQAVDVERVADPERRAQRIAQGAITMQAFERAVAETPAEFFRELLEDLTQCGEQFDKLCAVLDEKCGSGPDGFPAAPPSSNIRGALTTAREELENVARNVLQRAADRQSAGEVGGTGAAGSQPQGIPSGRIQSRDDAFRALLQVAEFFRRTEPHSPVSYALEQAVRWGRMPLPELLSELIPEQAVREHLFRLVGIKPPEQQA